jgi:enoyl-[acyl-carrier-protein] reductase (NADH)
MVAINNKTVKQALITGIATGKDIAEAVAFLASDSAKNICGERLVLDGGCAAQLLPSDVDN